MTPARLRRLAYVGVPLVLGAVLLAVWLPGDGEPAANARSAGSPRPHAPAAPAPDEGAYDPEPDAGGPSVLEGRVEDGAQRRIGGARIVLRPVHEDPTEITTTSATDGTFRFEVPEDGAYFAFAEHPRHVPGGIAGPFSVRDGQVPDGPVVIVLGSAAALVVRVVDPAGSPLAAAHVVLEGEPVPAAETDGRGEVSWTALRPAGNVTVSARAPGWAAKTAPARLSPGEITEVLVSLDAGRELHGRVVDPTRRGVAGATVRALADPHRMGGTSAMTTTDEAGDFVLVDLPESSVVLVASHDDYATSDGVVADVGARFVEIPLRAPASLSGWVRTQSGTRVPDAQIVLLDQGEDQPSMRSDERGEFAYTKLVPGHYVVVARAGDDAGRTEVDVAAGEDVRGVEVLLGGTFTVQGLVLARGTSEPIPGARVRPRAARVGGGSRMPSTHTDDEGRFLLEGVTVDATEIDVRAAGFRGESFPFSPTGNDMDLGTVMLEPRVFGGVGLGLRVADGLVQVSGIYDDTPAARAGLAMGDSILEVDGEAIGGMSLEDVVNKIRGTEGSDVRLRVSRQGEPEPFVVDLTRETIEPDKMEREGR